MIKNILKGLLVLFTIGIMLNGLMYLSFSKELALLSTKPVELTSSWFYMMMFYFHVGFGSIALGTGVAQLIFTLNKMKAHRSIGKIYMVAVLFSGSGGLYISFFANTGLIAQMGFFMLAVSWLTTSYLAYFHIRRGDVSTHKKWILRSMALTFSALTLRVLLPGSIIAGLTFEMVYPIIAWACWVPNLIVNELIAKRVDLKVA